ncbi:hypothetical protein PsWM33_02371 [Pseudovibrio sp. WM33]|nr:hypothetical protein PsWM33_02371 [Pseudovibrio sp. WM33]
MRKSDWPRTLIRIPPDTKKFLLAQTERNASSVNSEIVRCIRHRMDDLGRAANNNLMQSDALGRREQDDHFKPTT